MIIYEVNTKLKLDFLQGYNYIMQSTMLVVMFLVGGGSSFFPILIYSLYKNGRDFFDIQYLHRSASYTVKPHNKEKLWLIYSMSKKSCPFLVVCVLYKNGQNLLDIQYLVNHVGKYKREPHMYGSAVRVGICHVVFVQDVLSIVI